MTAIARRAHAHGEGLFIGGRRRWGGKSVERCNPARTQQVVGRSAAAGAADVADAHAAAVGAAPGVDEAAGQRSDAMCWRAPHLSSSGAAS